jgi:predicted P-loop ATPase/GTPase
MNLLVAGAAAVDAGKTTFSVGLCHETGATGFKPRAGNGFWYDHDDCLHALGQGRLYGSDARRLADVSGTVPEAINAVHRLWLPAPGERGILGRDGRAFAVDRVRRPAGAEGWDDPPAGSPGPRRSPSPSPDPDPGSGAAGIDAFVVNDTVDLPAAVERSLPLAEAPGVTGLEGFNDLMARLHRPATAALGERVRAADRAVVESYADVARPLEGFEPDAVAVVEPARCRVYDGDRYARACRVASGSAHEGRLEERVPAVVDPLDPTAAVSLPPLSAGERDDPAAVADAYDPAYRALLAAAVD